jgi:hypothetical protein
MYYLYFSLLYQINGLKGLATRAEIKKKKKKKKKKFSSIYVRILKLFLNSLTLLDEMKAILIVPNIIFKLLIKII